MYSRGSGIICIKKFNKKLTAIGGRKGGFTIKVLKLKAK